MDMQINTDFIKTERQKRGWSQEQLAATTSLGVRTIQRIESSGVASNESAKALAAVLEVSLTQLVATRPAWPRQSQRAKLLAYSAVASIAAVAAIFLAPFATATEVAMRVALKSEASGESKMNIAAEDGKQTEIKLEKDLRLVFAPKILRDDRILLSLELYGYDGTEYKLVSKQSVLLQDDINTALALSLGDNKPVQLSITPKTK